MAASTKHWLAAYTQACLHPVFPDIMELATCPPKPRRAVRAGESLEAYLADPTLQPGCAGDQNQAGGGEKDE